MAKVSQLGYVGIGASNPAAWQALATQVYGMEVVPGDDADHFALRLDDHPHRLAVRRDDRDDIEYIGWQVPDAASFQAIAQQLEDRGVEVSAGTRDEVAARQVVDLLHCEDPDGTPTEVFYGRPVNQQPFRPSRPISGYRSGDLGMGHVLLFARDLDQTVRFYCDLLGFRVSDYVTVPRPGGQGQVRAAFLHCNPRHHSIAFIEAPNAHKRINHIMFEANTMDDVGRGRDSCLESGVPIAIDLGRHMNDRVVSFYMGNPSGWALEYGWDGRLVDDATWQVEQYTSLNSLWGHPQLQEIAAHI